MSSDRDIADLIAVVRDIDTPQPEWRAAVDALDKCPADQFNAVLDES